MLMSWMDFENPLCGYQTVLISCARWLWFQIFQVLIVRNKDARKQISVLLSKDEFLYWFSVNSKAPWATLFWNFLLKHWEEVQIIMESDEGCHPFIETPGVFVPNVTMLVVAVVNVNLQAKAHKLHNVTAGLHCVTILYLNLQAAKQRNPNVSGEASSQVDTHLGNWFLFYYELDFTWRGISSEYCWFWGTPWNLHKLFQTPPKKLVKVLEEAGKGPLLTLMSAVVPCWHFVLNMILYAGILCLAENSLCSL